MNQSFDALIRLAIELGATGAEIIDSSQISVEESLAALCNGEPSCEQFAMAPSCPPHVSGPSGFRIWQRESNHAIVVKIEILSATLFSEERREVMQLLHEIVATVEQRAKKSGFYNARAFAGGSCKNIWCSAHTVCRVLSNGGECRNPERARPSMSGFGINVTKLMECAGWSSKKALKSPSTDAEFTSWVAGLILL